MGCDLDVVQENPFSHSILGVFSRVATPDWSKIRKIMKYFSYFY